MLTVFKKTLVHLIRKNYIKQNLLLHTNFKSAILDEVMEGEKSSPAVSVSVIIPVYNVEEYLPRCLDSVLKQSRKDYEIICVDDGSTDGCGDILDRYAEEHAAIRVIHRENGGLSVARNSGMRVARGEYIYFLDSDDFIHPQMLETTLHFAETEQADMVCFGMKSVCGEVVIPEPIAVNELSCRVETQPLYAGGVPVSVWSKIYRRRLLEGIEFVPGIRYEDVPFSYAILMRHPRTVFVDRQLYYYEMRVGSISRSNLSELNLLRDYAKVLHLVCELYAGEGKEREREALGRLYLPGIIATPYHMFCSASRGEKAEASRVFASALRELHSLGLLSRRGHRLRRYLKYRWSIFRATIGQKQVR